MIIPTELPAGLECYGRSPEFTPETLPAKLQASHATKAGTWGVLTVLEGAVLYRLEAPRKAMRLVRAGETLVIEEQVPHSAVFMEPGRFYIAFYRHATT